MRSSICRYIPVRGIFTNGKTINGRKTPKFINSVSRSHWYHTGKIVCTQMIPRQQLQPLLDPCKIFTLHKFNSVNKNERALNT